MKNYQSHLPSALLLAYTIYSAFIPTAIAHALVIFSLAMLAGYNTYLSSQKAIKHNEEVLREMRLEFETKLNSTKEFYDRKVNKLEDEMGKMQLNQLPPKTVSSSPIPRKVVF